MEKKRNSYCARKMSLLYSYSKFNRIRSKSGSSSSVKIRYVRRGARSVDDYVSERTDGSFSVEFVEVSIKESNEEFDSLSKTSSLFLIDSFGIIDEEDVSFVTLIYCLFINREELLFFFED